MKWEQGEESDNLEDRRRMKPRTAAVGGLGLLAVLAISYFLGVDPQQLTRIISDTQSASGGGGVQVDDRPLTPEEERTRAFAAKILRFTEKVWEQKFQESGETYERPKMVLFAQEVATGCGVAPGAVGPFYCPADRT